MGSSNKTKRSVRREANDFLYFADHEHTNSHGIQLGIALKLVWSPRAIRGGCSVSRPSATTGQSDYVKYIRYVSLRLTI
jgi:hypothetical protein